MLFREGKHLDIRRQGRASHYDHELSRAGRIPQHFRELHLGPAETIRGRQGQCCLQPLPWLRPRTEWRTCCQSGGIKNNTENLPALSRRYDAVWHQQKTHGRR